MAARVNDVAYGGRLLVTSVAATGVRVGSRRSLEAQAIKHRLHRLDAREIHAHLMVTATLTGGQLKTAASIFIARTRAAEVNHRRQLLLELQRSECHPG